MNQCPNCKERMWSANKGSLMICLNPDCIVEDDHRAMKNEKRIPSPRQELKSLDVSDRKFGKK